MNLLAELATLPLSHWQNFYVIVGSSGGALIGVQFVVIALIADRRHLAHVDSIGAFGTPTVVHFGAALTLAAVMSAPWPSLFAASVALAICGLLGLGYTAIVFRRARRQKAYKPVTEDWFWYTILPCIVYAALTLAAFLVPSITQPALFIVGGAALSLLLLGIHNSWDTVTYIVATASQADASKPA